MSKQRILLVDDEPMVQRVLRLSLEKSGYAVDTAHNGQEALMLIKAQAPDVMITDIEMPVMDGRTLCQTLERDMPDRTFPIFLATSLTGLEHRGWSGLITNLYFLEKPVSARMLITALAEYFAHGPSEVLEKMS